MRLALLCALVLFACGPKTTATLHDTATCAESAAAKDLQPTIAAALQASGDIATKILAAFESGLGADLVDCVVTAVKNDLLAKQAASPATARAVQNADAWLNRHKHSSLLKSESPEWRGREPAVMCVASWIPEDERDGHPVCPTAMSRAASAQ